MTREELLKNLKKMNDVQLCLALTDQDDCSKCPLNTIFDTNCLMDIMIERIEEGPKDEN